MTGEPMITKEIVTISSFSEDKIEIRLRYRDGSIQKCPLAETKYEPAMKSGDEVEATFSGINLIELAFHKQENQPAKAEEQKKSIPQSELITKEKDFVIIKDPLSGDKKLDLSEPVKQYIKWFKEGQLVGYEATGKTLTRIWKVDEYGERPPKKNGYGQSNGEILKGFGLLGSFILGIYVDWRGYDKEKTAYVLNDIINIYNAILPSLEKEVKS